MRKASLILVALALVAGFGLLGEAVPIKANPVSGPDVNTAANTVSATWAPGGVETATLTADTAGIIEFVSAEVPSGTDNVSGLGTSTLNTLDVNDTSIVAEYECISVGTTTFTIEHQGATLTSGELDCVEVGANESDSSHPIRLNASPDVLFCGGTTRIDAVLFGPDNQPVPGDWDFQFSLSIPEEGSPTGSGNLIQIDHDTAELTLEPAHRNATVTVGLPAVGIPPNTIYIQNFCAPEGAPHGVVSVVVTANPNVVECGGSSVITATGRDAAGHVVEGLGYHFATNVGLLTVSPNSAENEGNIAKLTLQPGMQSSTVLAAVGTTQGTVQGTVTVQQFCPGVTANPSQAIGLIDLSVSNNNLVCGETIFIGALVRDNKGQVPPDGTTVNFLATSGVVMPASANTINGALNVTYTAAQVKGGVRITAASGSSYGFEEVNIECSATQAAQAGAGGAGGPAPCIDIGDGVCISPPNTGGGRITPPNTGSGGLR